MKRGGRTLPLMIGVRFLTMHHLSGGQKAPAFLPRLKLGRRLTSARKAVLATSSKCLSQIRNE
jgi:hypothetical protein